VNDILIKFNTIVGPNRLSHKNLPPFLTRFGVMGTGKQFLLPSELELTKWAIYQL
jgi:hypothetical protein